MNVLEQLARLSGGHPMGGGIPSTGTDRLLPGQIAAWFAGADPFGTNLAFAKYALDAKAHSSALETLSRLVAAVHGADGKNIQKVTVMASGALSDWIAGDVCPKCDGNGSLLIAQKVVNCPRCEGSGHQERSRRAKFRSMQIPMPGRQSSIQLWESRYDWCIRHMDTSLANAVSWATRRAK
jgi:Zn ribbon nucleic-acid-binding protein